MPTQSQLEACAARIAARTTLGTKGALDLLAEVADRAEQMRQTGVSDPIVTAAHDLATRTLQAAKESRADALRNAVKRNAALTEIRTAGGIRKAYRTLEAMLVWTPRGGGRLDSIEAKAHDLTKRLIAPMVNRLRRDGTLDVAIKGDLDYEVAEAGWRASGGAADPNVQISAPAQKIADAMFPALDLARDRLNGAGARIGDGVDYVARTNWDGRQMRAAAGAGKSFDEAFAAWWAKDGPRMADKTFEDLVPEDGETMEQAKLRFARAVFEGRSTGVVLTHRGAGMAADADYVPPAWEGTHNLGRSMSHQRTIYWKSARDWVDHMREFGGGRSLLWNATNTLEQAGRRVSLMDRLGTNPRGNWNMIKERLLQEYRSDGDGVNEFNKRFGALDRIMDRLDGRANLPVNETAAMLTEFASAWETTTKLGFVALTHGFAAPMTVSAELAHHGVSRIESLPKTLAAMLTGRGSVERQEILDEAGSYYHGYLAALHAKSRIDPSVPGYMAWANANFMRITGLPTLLDRFHANGVKAVLMQKLGKAENYDALNPHIQALLKRYGVAPEDFNLLEAAEIDGRQYLTPDAPMNVPDAEVEGHLRTTGRLAADAAPETIAKAVQSWRWDMGDRLGMYLNDAAEHATVTPGARERAKVFGNLAPGSVGWMLAKAFSQFKMWPLAAMNQIIGREIGLSLSKKQAAFGIGSIIALSTLGGMGRMITRDFLSGRPQHDYTDWRTLAAAMAQGGGLGIYGDFLFGETSRFNAGLWSTLAGPMAADADALARMLFRFKADLHDHPDKAMEHLWPELAHFGVSHVPFANLAYLKGAADYLLFWHIFEAASPGWWDRTNRRLIREQGRAMNGYEPGQPIPWTPWGLGHPTYQTQ